MAQSSEIPIWRTAGRPGYLGKMRDHVTATWNASHGPEGVGWRLAYSWGELVVDRPTALQVYEDAYCVWLDRNPSKLDWITSVASDVYDTAPSNAGQLDYIRQETPSNHVHDVAIRRAVARLGRAFRGDRLVHVRGPETEGFQLSPGVVPFHKPLMIDDEPIDDPNGEGPWWRIGSVEDFYQRNKLLQVRDARACEIVLGGGHPGERECGAPAAERTFDDVWICRACARLWVANGDEDLLQVELLRTLGVQEPRIAEAATTQARWRRAREAGET